MWCFDKSGARGSPRSSVSGWELRKHEEARVPRRNAELDEQTSLQERFNLLRNREIRSLALDERQEGMLIESVPLTLNIHRPQMSAPEFPMQERGFGVLHAR